MSMGDLVLSSTGTLHRLALLWDFQGFSLSALSKKQFVVTPCSHIQDVAGGMCQTSGEYSLR